MAAKKKSSSDPSALKVAQKALLIIAIFTVLYLIKGWFVAAVVNGDPISRKAVIKELEREQGKGALDWLITKKLILQEARKRNIVVTQKEVDEEIAKMEKALAPQGQSFDQALALQGLSRESLKDRIKLSKIIEKIFSKDIVVTEKEVEDFIEKNRESIPAETDIEKVKPAIREQLRSQKVDQKGNEWIKKLTKDAKVFRFVDY
ncbi:hypothetical protein A3B50_04525 [Candidatus Roizmanbacteria bacterium RIFCSPLOWO2_01_FULL_40_42]|uniref:peptidylprolyl isomerase n=1 Tax=Candidatus Roizmanbacteria bacterium RIFCSPLOWO2_01_FULL_40_42 TaxID=1802066 RepID=A0A1F7J537_9BACT|nr:MAG: hypothetical protein A3C31_01135 [Candidatus Roizmanbacteria bacterium RIFCSPHIGHO2_02_FULL_40_53]OGK30416.1 MAG: hypothetical protein A2W49_00870 [Candidatus Roizmanbacteria bacterium RIFCSPHIGHO2_12_41_18]OGK36553.1 MAG: hypothetical protein A3E69_03425 [Candidatus Roizmanbacteria bacterium RIFCSPHIGHO2_12_FULL_40_130]OGK50734.1 MAG: hypothetical protein A3B50_04525 [Candidatus Roizmanbacteria bacterium RIFCSPLOWO2_01_FULL_40_42]OGK59669.1 MAG: hypothetical protein A3H84_00260 [Candid